MIHPITVASRKRKPLEPSAIKSGRSSKASHQTPRVKTTKFLLIVVPSPRRSPSAAAMLRGRKSISKTLSDCRSPPSRESESTCAHDRQLQMRAKLGTPPPVGDSPCPAQNRHGKQNGGISGLKHSPTDGSPRQTKLHHTRSLHPRKRPGSCPRRLQRSRQGLLFTSTPLPGKPRSLFFSKAARKRFWIRN